MAFSCYRLSFLTLAFFSVTLFGFYHLRLKPLLSAAGIWRDIEPIGNEACKIVSGLQACESG
jgi:hypothetical protein